MVAYRPTVDDNARRVLQVIRERGVAPGWQVMSEASVSDADLVNAVGTLMKLGLIKASGGASNPKEVCQAYFNILPSQASLAEMILSS